MKPRWRVESPISPRDCLSSPIQCISGTKDISARELLDAGVRRLQLQLDQQRQDVRAALLESAGNAYRGIGAYPDATRLIEQAIELRRSESASRAGLVCQGAAGSGVGQTRGRRSDSRQRVGPRGIGSYWSGLGSRARGASIRSRSSWRIC